MKTSTMTHFDSHEAIQKFFLIFLGFIFLALFCDMASAQSISVGGTSISTGSGNGAPGNDAWTAVKAVWFGPMGLIFGAVIFTIAVYYFFKEGVLATFGVLAIGTLFFFIPAIAVSAQNWAKNF